MAAVGELEELGGVAALGEVGEFGDAAAEAAAGVAGPADPAAAAMVLLGSMGDDGATKVADLQQRLKELRDEKKRAFKDLRNETRKRQRLMDKAKGFFRP